MYVHDKGHQYYKRKLIYLCEDWRDEATEKLRRIEVTVMLTS